MTLTFNCVFVAEGREPSGFAAFTGHSPNGLRRSANKVSGNWLAPRGFVLGSQLARYPGTESCPSHR